MKARHGFTLIEVVAAMLVSAVMVSAVFSVALSNKQTSARSDRRLVAAQATQSLMLKLSEYIAADASATSLPGPGGSWAIPGDSLGNVYALCAGTHVLGAASGLVPTQLTQSPFNGNITYTVAWTGCNVPCSSFPNAISSSCQPTVTAAASWTEP